MTISTTAPPATVTIPQLPAGTTVDGTELFEAIQTSSGVGYSVQLTLSQMMATVVGALPTGGSLGNMLVKSSGINYAATWTTVLNGPLGVIGTSTITGALNVLGTTTVTGAFTVIGTAAFTSYVLITNSGAAAQPQFVTRNPTFQVLGLGADQTSLSVCRYVNSANTPARLDLGHSRGATVGDYTVVSQGDTLGEFNFLGSDGSTLQAGAVIRAFVDATPGTNDMPGRLVLFTTPDGSTSPVEAVRVDSSQRVGIGKTPATLLDVNGPFGLSAPVTYSNSTVAIATTDASVIFNRTSTVTVTLLAAASFTGRFLYAKTLLSAVNSTTANIVPLGTTVAVSTILAATTGKWVVLQSDGSNWVTMMGN